jgi:hypothetical protein
MVFRRVGIYNRPYMSGQIQKLLEMANSSGRTDTSVNFAKRAFDSKAAASEHFEYVSRKLFDINEWSESSSASNYALFDESGKPINGHPLKEGNFIRIHLFASGKYDWVRVESIFEDGMETVVTVKPTFDPTAEKVDEAVISHFFWAEAENNFCVLLHGTTVTFYVIGINERQNIAETENIVESVRNAAAANLGYYLGIQKTVWKEFSTNMLQANADAEF